MPLIGARRALLKRRAIVSAAAMSYSFINAYSLGAESPLTQTKSETGP